MEPDGLAGKSAIVTGAAKPDGIGRACVNKLHSLGVKIVLCDLDGASLDAARTDYREFRETIAIQAADVTSQSDANKAVELALEMFGTLDILVNNAGVGIGSHDFLETNLSDWSTSLDVNVMGAVHFIKAALPEMIKSNEGSIINIASLSGLGAIPSIPACYTASKFAAIGLTKQVAQQYAHQNIRCNAVCPGSVKTDMMKNALELIAAQEEITVEEAEKLEASTIPAGRPASPMEVAETVAFLAGPLSRYLTGVALPVAGGMAPGI